MKPVLFVELDGPILIPAHGDDREPLFNAKFADYAKPFMHWAKEHFDVRVMTNRHPVDVVRAMEKLSLPGDAVSVVTYDDSKIPHVAPHKDDFYWIDSVLLPSEVAWLAHHNKIPRVLTVDPEVGVVPLYKQHLEEQLHR